MSVPVVGGKKVPWSGWAAQAPRSRGDRKKLLAQCGQKCFLGPNLSFPVCSLKNTKPCQVQQAGVWAAYIRAKEFNSLSKRKRKSKRHNSVYKRILAKTRKLLKKL